MENISIANMSGDELVRYLHVLSEKQAGYSKLKIQLTEELTPIQQALSAKRAEIQVVVDKQKQVKIEIAAVKYGIKSEANS